MKDRFQYNKELGVTVQTSLSEVCEIPCTNFGLLNIELKNTHVSATITAYEVKGIIIASGAEHSLTKVSGDDLLPTAGVSKKAAFDVSQYQRVTLKVTSDTANTTVDARWSLYEHLDSAIIYSTTISGAISLDVDMGAGSVDTKTPRVTIATNDANMAAINSNIATLADWDNASGDGASVTGDVAHDTADAGEPVKIGFRARTSRITAVANDDRTNAVSNEYGEQVIASYDWSSGDLRMQEQNSLASMKDPSAVTFVNVTTPVATTPYPSASGIIMGDNNRFVAQGTAGANSTHTFENSLDGGTTWQDITNEGINASTGTIGTASFSNTSYKISFKDILGDIRMKVADTAGEANYCVIRRSVL